MGVTSGLHPMVCVRTGAVILAEELKLEKAPPLAGWGLSGQTLKTWDWPPALLPAPLLISGGQST